MEIKSKIYNGSQNKESRFCISWIITDIKKITHVDIIKLVKLIKQPNIFIEKQQSFKYERLFYKALDILLNENYRQKLITFLEQIQNNEKIFLNVNGYERKMLYCLCNILHLKCRKMMHTGKKRLCLRFGDRDPEDISTEEYEDHYSDAPSKRRDFERVFDTYTVFYNAPRTTILGIEIYN